MDDAPARLRRMRELFDAVVDLPPDERGAWLDRATGWDTEMRRDVADLITSADRTESPLRPPSAADRSLADADGAGLVGQRLGPYDVVRLVGMGGMGAVYEAKRADDQYQKRVAIKIVQRGLSSELTIARFRRERQILATLEHKNIATLLDGGVTPDGRPFLVMEFVEGSPITTWCDERNLTIPARLGLVRQVCAAVEHAHKKLVVHGDLKPGNIFVTAEGTVKLLDFGIARLVEADGGDAGPLTRGGARAFTPEYASPEQIRGDALATYSDIYSLGVVLFELLTGRRPHAVGSHALVDIERAVLEGPTLRPSAVITPEAAVHAGEKGTAQLRRRLEGELDQIALMALRKEPERRYPSVEALSDDLRRHLGGLPIRAQHDWAGYRLRKFAQRNRAAVTASALVLVALIGGVITTTAQARRAQKAQRREERVNGFLTTILSSVRPATGGRDVPVSEVLDSAARRLAVELATQPEERADLESVIGESYLSLGRYDEAEQHLRAALALRTQVEGARSRGVVVVLSNLGTVYLNRGVLDGADSIFRQALAIQRTLGSDSDTLLAVLVDDLGSVAHHKGQPTEAERLHREALELHRRVQGDRSDATALAMTNVAVSLGEQSKWAAAESLHRASLAIFRANHPGPNTQVADAADALATVLDLQGKNPAAESAYVEVMAMRKQLYGPQHPSYAWTVFNYAAFSYEIGEYQRAADLTHEILALRGKTLPESHPAIASALQTLGRCQDRLGDHAGAEQALRESVTLRQKYLPADSWLIGSSEGFLAEHFLLLKDYPRAEQLELDADRILVKGLGLPNSRTQTNVKRLVALYDAWGKPEKAVQQRARLSAK